MSTKIDGKRLIYDQNFISFLLSEIDYVGLQNKNNLIRAINFLYHSELDLDSCSDDEILNYLATTTKDFLYENKISSRTLDKFSQNTQEDKCNIDTLRLIAEGLYFSRYMGIRRIIKSKEDALPLIHLKIDSLDSPIPISAYHQLDTRLVKSMQILAQNAVSDDLEEQYLMNVLSIFSDKRLFISFYNKFNLDRYLQEIMNNLNLYVTIKDDLSCIQYKTKEASISIENPQLLWDCCCYSPREDGLAQEEVIKKCPIHGQIDDKSISNISNAFGNENIAINFGKGTYIWKNGYVWPPSIDSLHLVPDVLEYIHQNSLTPSSILDVGSGTGFLGIELALSIPSIELVKLSDFTSTATLYSSLNIELNKPRFGNRNIGMFATMEFNKTGIRSFSPVEDKKEFDLIVCNPPYIPIKDDYYELRKFNPVSGLILLKWVLSNCPSFGKNVFVSFSNIADHEIQPFAKAKGIRLEPIGGPHKIPFRVPEMFSEEKNFFSSEIRPYLKPEPFSPHYYYHIITTYLVS